MSIGCESCEVGGFEFLAPTTRRNTLRVLRAMQLPKPGMVPSVAGLYFLFDQILHVDVREFFVFFVLAFSIDLCFFFPVLLEGSPGVGKTSLIVALGKFSGHKVVRINLSEQVSSSW